MKQLIPAFGLALCIASALLAAEATTVQSIEPRPRHLRYGPAREWDDFAETADGDRLVVKFESRANATEQCLRIRQRDLRYDWKVTLNGNPVGKLLAEDASIVAVLPVGKGMLKDGVNELEIAPPAAKPGAIVQSDDVAIGPVDLIPVPRSEYLGQATLKLDITGDDKAPIPARIVILDEQSGLMTLGTASNAELAIRPGVIYTTTGSATVTLPAGRYTVIAGRGFEWGIRSATIDAAAGRTTAIALPIAREVDTRGYVAADTHMHTVTYARHGDATMPERMATLAGEGIELPISTEHNLQIDFDAPATACGVRRHFTPVLGNELTVKLGHYNVFPIARDAKLIDFRAPTWPRMFASVDEIAPGAVRILNHGRDVHYGFRPLDPSHHISLTGEALEDWLPPLHGMEVLNSGATTIDPLILFHDWLGLLNRGLRIAPIGGSDSHDVNRYLVGQGRTYVRCDDADPGKIDVARACEAIKRGDVLVSYGLMVEMTVNGQYRSGDLANVSAGADEIECRIEVRGPSWTQADRVALYVNGTKVKDEAIARDDGAKSGTKRTVTWKVPRPRQDIHLVALAMGPGIQTPFWPNARPYQPTGTNWKPYVLGCTGAVYVDADQSGKYESPLDCARQLWDPQSKPDINLARLAGRDPAIILQAAALARTHLNLNTAAELLKLGEAASAPDVREAFGRYARAWQETLEARARAAVPTKP